MAEFSKLVVTRKGQALIAKMLAGTATITVSVGEGSNHTAPARGRTGRPT